MLAPLPSFSAQYISHLWKIYWLKKFLLVKRKEVRREIVFLNIIDFPLESSWESNAFLIF